MITWLDAAFEPLISLGEPQDSARLTLTEERELTLMPSGGVQAVPYSPASVFVGEPGVVRADAYGLTLVIDADSKAACDALKAKLNAAAVRTRFIARGAAYLPIAMFKSLSLKRWSGYLAGGEYTAEFHPAQSHWVIASHEREISPGVNEVIVGGDVPAPLHVTITAGAAPIVNPSVVTDAGTTTLLGILPAGGVLAIDARPGVWTVTVNGVNAKTSLTGPQPFLRPGARSVTLTAAGASGRVQAFEGVYL